MNDPMLVENILAMYDSFARDVGPREMERVHRRVLSRTQTFLNGYYYANGYTAPPSISAQIRETGATPLRVNGMEHTLIWEDEAAELSEDLFRTPSSEALTEWSGLI